MPKTYAKCPKCNHEFYVDNFPPTTTAICPKCGTRNEDYIIEAQEKKRLKRIEDDRKRRESWGE